MKAIVSIELFNDDVIHEDRQLKNFYNCMVPTLGNKVFGTIPSSGWVAEIIGFDPKYKYARTFLKFKKDYSQANSKGSRGIFAEYILDENKIYEIKQQVTWKRSERYFCKVQDWKIVKITEQEVVDFFNRNTTLEEMKSWLNDTSRATSWTQPVSE